MFTLQNFWYLLRATWIHQIQMQVPSTDATKNSYIRHIATGNNYQYHTLSINIKPHMQIFFCTLSLVLNITIQVHSIINNSHQTQAVNTCQHLNPIKIVNIRTAIKEQIICEPWINPQVIKAKQLVCVLT